MAGGCLATVGVVRGPREGSGAALPCLALPCPALPCLALPCPALPRLAPPCLALPSHLGRRPAPPVRRPLFRPSERGKPVDRHPELMVSQEVPDPSRCLEEGDSLDESSTSSSEVLSASNMKKSEVSEVTAKADIKPKSMHRAKIWSDDVENLYRFQQAGYRDEVEYKQVKQVDVVECWPETGYIKKLQRRDNTFYYYNKQRECEDKDVPKVKVYVY